MEQERDKELFPISAWSIGPVQFYKMITIRFDYLDNPHQAIEEAHRWKRFALTPDQARELISEIQNTLQMLETLAPEPDPTKTN